MRYAVLIVTGDASQRLRDALAGQYRPRKVYVVGMSEDAAFARALSGDAVGIIEIEELDSAQALAFARAEVIGTENMCGDSFDRLIEVAKRRARQLQEKQPC